MFRTLLIVLAMLALASGNAAARAPGTLFSQVDHDRDGLVSWPEAQFAFPNLDRVHFGRCDRNNDGRLDRQEHQCLRQIYEMLYERD